MPRPGIRGEAVNLDESDWQLIANGSKAPRAV